MHSGQTETIEKPVARTTNESQSTASIERPEATASFADRHIGPSRKETAEMLRELDFENVDALLDEATAAAEAMALCHHAVGAGGERK